MLILLVLGYDRCIEMRNVSADGKINVNGLMLKGNLIMDHVNVI